MAHDVMIASAMADMAKAQLVAKRLRALKLRVRLDAKREHTTPTARDLNDANRAGSVLVLWSKAACDTGTPDSDWVHSMAHLARSRRGALLQAGLDASVPDDPFDKDERYKLTGMGPKRIPNGFFELVGALEKKTKRRDLAEFLRIDPKDKDAIAAWKKAHPRDPISQAGKPKKTAPVPKPAAKPAARPAGEAAPEETPASAPSAAAAATAGMAKASAPPTPPQPPKAPAATQFAYKRPHPATLHDDSDEIEVGWKMLAPIMAGCLLMLILAFGMRSRPASQPSMPAIGNAAPVHAQVCPPGQVPRSLLEVRPLRTGPIIDDTQDEVPED